MTDKIKTVDYIDVYYERTLIDGVLYSKYVIHNETKIGIPLGVTFYTRLKTCKYVRLAGTDTVNGITIRYRCKESQIRALLTVLKIKALSGDTRPSADMKSRIRKESKTGDPYDLPTGVFLTRIKHKDGIQNRISVSVYCPQTKKFKRAFIRAGMLGDDIKLQEAIKRGTEMRKQSMDTVAAITHKKPSQGL